MNENIEDDLPLPSFNEVFGEIVKELNNDNQQKKVTKIKGRNISNFSNEESSASNNITSLARENDSNMQRNFSSFTNPNDIGGNNQYNNYYNTLVHNAIVSTGNQSYKPQMPIEYKNYSKNIFLPHGNSDNASAKKKTKKEPDENAAGRWTPEEHKLFLEGIMLYGKDWKKIQPMIGTRSLVQIRTHAQKVFKKIGLKQLNTSNEFNIYNNNSNNNNNNLSSLNFTDSSNDNNILKSSINAMINASNDFNSEGTDEE